MNHRTILSKFIIISICLLTTPSLAATITGSVTYEGAAPKFREIKMDADPICLGHNKNPVYPQTLVLGENQEMGNVFVHIAKGIPRKAFEVPSEPATITQEGCMYDPHVLGVMVGQSVKILNPDGTLHNIHALPKINKEFNLAMPKFRKEVTKTFDKEEFMFPIKCDVHPWMGAWMAVMTHPYFDVTKSDGKFTLDNLPPGEYQLQAWHEKLGPQMIPITLGEEETKEVNFTFSKPAAK